MWAGIVKALISLITSKKGRKILGWVLLIILSPLILIILFFCALGDGLSQHNQAVMGSLFGGEPITSTTANGDAAAYIATLQTAQTQLAALDSAAAAVNADIEGAALDTAYIKAAYCVLSPEGGMDVDTFLSFFYTTEQRTRTVTEEVDGETVTFTEVYTVTVALPKDTALHNLASVIGRSVTSDDRDRVNALRAAIVSGGANDNGAPMGDGNGADLIVTNFVDPSTKNAADLVIYVTNAWSCGWGYVWGSHGSVLTEGAFRSKLMQYPNEVGAYEEFIRDNWVGKRTADCVGLIKGYGWLDPATLTFQYGANNTPDVGANAMYERAAVKGTIDTMPEVPGLAVWHRGHIGVYIGSGEVVEAMGTRWGVVKTRLSNGGWTHWIKLPFIQYPEGVI